MASNGRRHPCTVSSSSLFSLGHRLALGCFDQTLGPVARLEKGMDEGSKST